MNKATTAKENTDNAQVREKIRLAYNSALTKDISDQKGEVQKSTFEDELTTEFPGKTIEIGESANKKEWIVTIDGVTENVPIGKDTPKEVLTKQADGTFKDSNNNEWVWIEVPKSVTASVKSDTDIESALRTYCSDIMPIGTSSDSYTTTTHGNADTWYDGCGLTEQEYINTKHTMLNSIKENGGFYIGKYETGIDGTESVIAGARTNEGETTQKAVIKADVQPYAYVTCSQAETLAKGLAPEGKTTSLLFGIQWDLVLKYLNVKNAKTIEQLREDSKSWGNYIFDAHNPTISCDPFYITSSNAMTSNDNGITWNPIAKDTEKKETSLLTTGSSSSLAPLNIYDFAGNLYELTLEKNSASSYPNTLRGGFFNYWGNSFPASSRVGYREAPYSSFIGYVGFRVALY